MTIMKWFRRWSKWTLVVLVALLMIGFGLPSLFQGQQASQIQEFGTYIDQNGNPQSISSAMVSNASREIEILRSLGISLISSPQLSLFSSNPATKQPKIPLIGAVHPISELAIYQLFFSDNQSAQFNQYYLSQLFQRGEWFNNPDRIELITNHIKQLTASESNDNNIYYLLLLAEATHAGWNPTTEQIDVLLQIRQQIRSNPGYPPLPSIEALKDQFGITDNDIKRVLANFLAIIRYADTIANPLVISEPQIKKTIRDRFEADNVSGSYIAFSAVNFKDKLKDPEQEELQTHFLAFADAEAGKATPENTFGFGYRLDDRLQVEYLRVELDQARTLVEQEYEKMLPKPRENKIEQYWKENRRLFQITIPAPIGAFDVAPTFRDPEFDEVADQAAEFWKEDQAAQRAREILARAKSSLKKISADPLSDERLAARAAEFDTFAKTHNESNPLKVTYFKSDFLSNDTIDIIPDFDRIVRQQRNQPDRGLLDILFDCEPLNDEQERSRISDSPLRFYEPLDQLTATDFQNNPVAFFLVRLIAVDKARASQSLDDDGSHGPYQPGKIPLDKSLVYQNVQRDYKNLQAYRLTQKYAHSFAISAKEDWDKALLEANLDLGDFDDPNKLNRDNEILHMRTLQQTRQTRGQFLESVNRSNNPPASFLNTIRRQTKMLNEAMKLAQDRRATPNENIALLERPSAYTVMVFQDLTIKAPYLNDYYRLKPYIASDSLWNRQALAALIHFNPKNIEKRNGYTKTTTTP